MPYIDPKTRAQLDKVSRPATVGELNYVLTKVCLCYLGAEPSYSRINDIIGALECCKQEIYRRVAAPYEDRKIAENGDVF